MLQWKQHLIFNAFGIDADAHDGCIRSSKIVIVNLKQKCFYLQNIYLTGTSIGTEHTKYKKQHKQTKNATVS